MNVECPELIRSFSVLNVEQDGVLDQEQTHVLEMKQSSSCECLECETKPLNPRQARQVVRARQVR